MKKQIYDIVFAAQYEGLTTKEATDKLFLLFSISGRSEQFNCGKERVFGENKCHKQCDDCLKEYGSN
jgi:hypothetical protein